jgi:hypothetical protein
MILDNTAVYSMAQQAANLSGKTHLIYQRKNGMYIFCAEGMFTLVRSMLAPNEQVTYVDKVEPKRDA